MTQGRDLNRTIEHNHLDTLPCGPFAHGDRRPRSMVKEVKGYAMEKNPLPQSRNGPLRSQNRLCRLLPILVHGGKLSGSISKWWKLKCGQCSPLHLSHVIKGYLHFCHDTYSLFFFGPFAISFWQGRGGHVILKNPNNHHALCRLPSRLVRIKWLNVISWRMCNTRLDPCHPIPLHMCI